MNRSIPHLVNWKEGINNGRQLIYILSSILTFLCSFVLLFSFRKQFKYCQTD